MADDRSDNKGAEFENVVHAEDLDLLFVHSERSHVIMVYDTSDPANPTFHQALPSLTRPEGGAYHGNVYVAACEEDDRGDKLRGGIVIYKYGSSSPEYPTLISDEDPAIGNGVPIAWSALSGLSPDPESDTTLYAVDDSAFKRSKIFSSFFIDVNNSGELSLRLPRGDGSGSGAVGITTGAGDVALAKLPNISCILAKAWIDG